MLLADDGSGKTGADDIRFCEKTCTRPLNPDCALGGQGNIAIAKAIGINEEVVQASKLQFVATIATIESVERTIDVLIADNQTRIGAGNIEIHRTRSAKLSIVVHNKAVGDQERHPRAK